MDVKTLWYEGTEQDWLDALSKYETMDSVERSEVEEELAHLNPDWVKGVNAEEFYTFLHEKYYVWKYTQPNRLATTIPELERYKTEGKEQLTVIKDSIFTLFSEAPYGTKELMKTVTQLHGLGPAGGSGLLSILFPEHYGTIDQFVVKSLQKVGLKSVMGMDPEKLTIEDAVVLEDIYRSKARELNSLSGGNYWTPRKIDMVLWTYGRNKCREEI